MYKSDYYQLSVYIKERQIDRYIPETHHIIESLQGGRERQMKGMDNSEVVFLLKRLIGFPAGNWFFSNIPGN